MAIYHLSVKIIGRSAGRSAVAAAAYRSGDIITNIYDGITHDYSNKQWIEHTNILLPPNAPDSFDCRDILWNSVEKAEKSKDAQLAREIEVALPRELSLNDQIELVEQYIHNNFVADGMCADYAIHNPPLRNDRGQPIDRNGNIVKNKKDMIFQNPHAHILLTIRPMDASGKWEAKSKIEYLCKRRNQEKPFTAEEFKHAKMEGWEKQYKYKDGKNKVWLTANEGKNRNLERVSKTPKTSIYGRKNPVTERWNCVETERKWRKQWEIEANQKLQECGISARIDSRSYKDQGRIDEIPSVHLGPAISQYAKRMEREGKHIQNEIYILNKTIMEHNRMVQELNIKIAELTKQIEKLTKASIGQIDDLKNELERNIILRDSLNVEIKNLDIKLNQLKETAERVSSVFENVSKANQESNSKISKWLKESDQCGFFNAGRKKELKQKIDTETKTIQDRNAYLSNVLRQYDMVSFSQLANIMKECEDVDIEKSQMVDNLMNCIENIKKMTLEYIELTISFDKRLEKSDIWDRFDNLDDEIRMEDIHNLLEKNEKVEIKKR